MLVDRSWKIVMLSNNYARHSGRRLNGECNCTRKYSVLQSKLRFRTLEWPQLLKAFYGERMLLGWRPSLPELEYRVAVGGQCPWRRRLARGLRRVHRTEQPLQRRRRRRADLLLVQARGGRWDEPDSHNERGRRHPLARFTCVPASGSAPGSSPSSACRCCSPS